MKTTTILAAQAVAFDNRRACTYGMNASYAEIPDDVQLDLSDIEYYELKFDAPEEPHGSIYDPPTPTYRNWKGLRKHQHVTSEPTAKALLPDLLSVDREL